jgi:microcystin-dependent protein
MADPFLGEIRSFSFSFAPRGWALCNGQLLPINQNMALFSLLGTTYGGDGRVNFALPDLRNRVPMHVGPAANQGARLGAETHTVTNAELPTHTHQPLTTTTSAQQGGSTLAGLAPAVSPKEVYAPQLQGGGAAMAVLTNVGGSQAHENRMPTLVITFCIALQGIYPSQN